MRKYTFLDVEDIQKRLADLADDLGYLVLHSVTGRNGSEKLARVNINETELRAYLHPRAVESDGDDEEDDSGDDDEPFDPEEALGAAVGAASAVDLANAAFRWLLQNAAANMNSTRKCKFKLLTYGPKGDRLIYSARFSCENPEWEPDDDDEVEAPRQAPQLVAVSGSAPARPPTPAVPPASTPPIAAGATAPATPAPAPVTAPANEALLMLDAIPEGRVWKALGGGYEHLLHLYERGFGNLATLQNEALAALSSQNVQNQGVIGELADRIVTLRVGGAIADAEAREEAGSTQLNTELGKTFISELGSLGRAYATSKLGLPPGLAGLVDIVSSSPVLLETLSAPEVQELLKDEKTLIQLSEILKQSAKNHAASRNTPPSPSPEGGDHAV